MKRSLSRALLLAVAVICYTRLEVLRQRVDALEAFRGRLERLLKVGPE